MAVALGDFALDPRFFNTKLYRAVRSIWFEGLPSALSTSHLAPAMGQRWFGRDAAFDGQCRAVGGTALVALGPKRLALPASASAAQDRAEHYGELVRPFRPAFRGDGRALAESIRDGSPPPLTALALVLLLDQLSRNVLRGPAQGVVYAHYDRLARAVAHDARALRYDVHFGPVARLWFYMPLMHSENRADHAECDDYLRAAIARAEAQGDLPGLDTHRRNRDFLQTHTDLLLCFGRYPHRNRWLGRPSTEEEKAYLDNEGETFGTG